MAMRDVVTIFKITTSDPGAPMEFSGRYDDKGEPILLKAQYSIEPGSLWQMDESDPDYLRFLEIGAVRLATPMELQLGHPVDA